MTSPVRVAPFLECTPSIIVSLSNDTSILIKGLNVLFLEIFSGGSANLLPGRHNREAKQLQGVDSTTQWSSHKLKRLEQRRRPLTFAIIGSAASSRSPRNRGIMQMTTPCDQTN